MPRLRYLPERDVPHNGRGAPWLPGDERDVSDGEAAWLLQFPAFREVVGPALPPATPTAVAEGGTADRAVKRTKRK